MRRAEKYARGVDAIRDVDPEFANKVLIGKMYEARKKSVGGQVANQHTVLQLSHFGTIADRPKSTAKADEVAIVQNEPMPSIHIVDIPIPHYFQLSLDCTENS